MGTAVEGVRAEPRPGLAHDAETFCEAFQRTARHYSEQTAVRAHGGGPELTWAQYADRVRALAAGLDGIGIGSGDTVAMMLRNRPEAVVLDTAAMHLGAIPFSIYNTSSPEQVEYLLGHAECRVAVTESELAERILAVAERLPLLERVYVVDGPRRGRARAGRARTGPARGRLRLRGLLAVRDPRSRRDADLHLGHHRAAEGRRADPPQPARRVSPGGSGHPAAARRPGGLLPADGPPRRSLRPLQLPAVGCHGDVRRRPATRCWRP